MGIRGLLCLTVAVADAAVIGIDFGARYLKVGIIQPGKGVDLVLNEATKRKSSTAAGFNNQDERVYGDESFNLLGKIPHKQFIMAKLLLGKNISHPDVLSFADQKFPYKFAESDETNAVLLQVSANQSDFRVACESLAVMGSGLMGLSETSTGALASKNLRRTRKLAPGLISLLCGAEQLDKGRGLHQSGRRAAKHALQTVCAASSSEPSWLPCARSTIRTPSTTPRSWWLLCSRTRSKSQRPTPGEQNKQSSAPHAAARTHCRLPDPTPITGPHYRPPLPTPITNPHYRPPLPTPIADPHCRPPLPTPITDPPQCQKSAQSDTHEAPSVGAAALNS